MCHTYHNIDCNLINLNGDEYRIPISKLIGGRNSGGVRTHDYRVTPHIPRRDKQTGSEDDLPLAGPVTHTKSEYSQIGFDLKKEIQTNIHSYEYL